jgi:hypothetical protein
LGRVICLEGPSEAELVERIIPGRRTSKATGEVYHLENDPPTKPEEMMDPGPFSEREDDTEEATRAHLEAYREEEGALKSHYEAKDLLTVVDAPAHGGGYRGDPGGTRAPGTSRVLRELPEGMTVVKRQIIRYVRYVLEYTSLVLCFLVQACRGFEPRFGEGGHIGGVGSQLCNRLPL